MQLKEKDEPFVKAVANHFKLIIKIYKQIKLYIQKREIEKKEENINIYIIYTRGKIDIFILK